MKTLVPFNRFLIPFLLLALPLISGVSALAQPTGVIPELTFRNPVLVSGVANKDNAIYRFNGVATDLDATVTIKKRSASNVIVRNIDMTSFGWDKALQPELGIAGNVAKNQTWWVEFEVQFWDAIKNRKQRIKEFNVTSLDVDGDGVSIREMVEMYNVKSVKYSTVTNLLESSIENTVCGADSIDSPLQTCSNCAGSGKNGLSDCGGCAGSGKLHSSCDHAWNGDMDKFITGPTGNFLNIDTAATAAMATYTYANKDRITFRMGGRSGNTVSNAGVRMNSLWFRAFNLSAPYSVLPVKLNQFTARLENKNVNLNWVVTDQKNFSHFIVERSFDALNYAQCATIFPNEDNISLQQSYDYLDAVGSVNKGMISYRLKMMDADGKAQYSSVAWVRINESSNRVTVQAFPNPVVSELKVSVPANWQNKEIVYALYQVNGILVKKMVVENAAQTMSINMNELKSGVYIVKVSAGNETAVQQIVKK